MFRQRPDADVRSSGPGCQSRSAEAVKPGKLNDVEFMLNEIGRLLAQDEEYPRDATLLYAELDTNMITLSIFKDRGDQIIYRHSPSRSLGELLLDLWESHDVDKRWTEMEYLVHDGKFTVNFTYPEEIDREEDSFKRRDGIVSRYVGDKPVVYPPVLLDDNNVFHL